MALVRAELQVAISDNFLDRNWFKFRMAMINQIKNGATTAETAEVVKNFLKHEKLLTVSSSLNEGGYLNAANTDSEPCLSGWLMIFQVWRMSVLDQTYEEVINYSTASDTVRKDMVGILTSYLRESTLPIDSPDRSRIQHARYWISMEKNKYKPSPLPHQVVVQVLVIWRNCFLSPSQRGNPLSENSTFYFIFLAVLVSQVFSWQNPSASIAYSEGYWDLSKNFYFIHFLTSLLRHPEICQRMASGYINICTLFSLRTVQV
jgi:hypothetical protein